MSLGINVFRNKRRRKKCRGNICHLGINIAQSSQLVATSSPDDPDRYVTQ